MYKYETHIHSIEGSACARSSARDMVQAYHQAGYTGFVLTNHFIRGNTSVPQNLDWKTRMQMYYDAYLEATDEGNKLDFDVLFGIEEWYEHGKEILIYGIDLDFLQSHPELEYASIDTYAKLVHEAGGLLVHAHPHRIRDYIKPDVQPRYDVCDGIEVYNAGDEMEINRIGMQDAIKLNMIMTSGGDIHKSWDERIGMAGMIFEKRIRSNKDFIEALKSRSGKLVIAGETEN